MKHLKKFSLLLALSLMSNIMADNLSAVPETGWGKESQKTNNGSNSNRARSGNPPKNQPKKPKSKQKDLFLIDGGAVYLRPYQGGTDFAQRINIADTLHETQEPYGTNKALDFGFDWGFRAGVGFQLGQSRQTLKATYLYLATDASKTTTSDFSDINPNPTSAVFVNFLELSPGEFGDAVQSAHSHWNLHFNMLDLTFGKKYPKKGCMNFEPFIGAKGILLSENQKSTYSIDAKGRSAKLKQKVNFQGAGVMGGLNLDWAMTKWLSFIGSFDAAFLYSSVETKRTSDDGIPSVLWIGSSHDIKATPMLDGMFALKGVYCWKRGQFIELKIGFEEHYLFQTMKHTLLNSDASTDLSLMGWFATLGFGF